MHYLEGEHTKSSWVSIVYESQALTSGQIPVCDLEQQNSWYIIQHNFTKLNPNSIMNEY